MKNTSEDAKNRGVNRFSVRFIGYFDSRRRRWRVKSWINRGGDGRALFFMGWLRLVILPRAQLT